MREGVEVVKAGESRERKDYELTSQLWLAASMTGEVSRGRNYRSAEVSREHQPFPSSSGKALEYAVNEKMQMT